ncbi:hypothetical protein [Hymenobacter sp. B81]|uniref:hypothetical protein n=1 Tax=Hymenobacter sp. B81 TaxID=3344878 RepID=UPI0037DD4AA3
MNPTAQVPAVVLRRPGVLFTVVRVFAGVLLLATGLSGLSVVLGFASLFPVAPVEFMHLMIGSGFLAPAKGMETVAGLLLLFNRYPRLALALEAPVALNVLLFHLCFDRANLWMGVVLLSLVAVLAWPHRQFYAGWLRQLLTR